MPSKREGFSGSGVAYHREVAQSESDLIETGIFIQIVVNGGHRGYLEKLKEELATPRYTYWSTNRRCSFSF